MMKPYLLLIMAVLSAGLSSPLVANDQFNRGMNLGSQNKGQGTSAIQDLILLRPSRVIPTLLLKPGITVV